VVGANVKAGALKNELVRSRRPEFEACALAIDQRANVTFRLVEADPENLLWTWEVKYNLARARGHTVDGLEYSLAELTKAKNAGEVVLLAFVAVVSSDENFIVVLGTDGIRVRSVLRIIPQPTCQQVWADD
jgi:hypothetical protein